MLRVYTCTPVRFRGDPWFFTRESGAFSRGLAEIGVESRAMLLGPRMDDDEPDLVRADLAELESPSFWEGLRLDGLVLYSWAAPQYHPIAKALRASGIPFLVNMDTCGVVSSRANARLWFRQVIPFMLRSVKSPREAGVFIARCIDNLGFDWAAKARVRTYAEANAITAVTPLAQLWIRNEAAALGRADLAGKIHYLPHPQLKQFSYRKEPKENLVISVGRWEPSDWNQKNPQSLLLSLTLFLEKNPDWKALIVGKGAGGLQRFLNPGHGSVCDRIEFNDFLSPEKIVPLYSRAKIGFWSSRSEGQQGTAAQALCCGCSVVAGNSGLLSCFHHYVSRESGRVALGMDPGSLAQALMLEADAWQSGHRDPDRISEIWTREFHSDAVAKRALQILGLVTA
jgi:glycosyltransferase involved in cell wall biosynthesis